MSTFATQIKLKTMKKIFFIIAAVLTLNTVFAQQNDSTNTNDELKTIFGKSGDKVKVSGFGAFNMDFGSIENNFGLMMGGEGAVLINRSFFIGFYGRGLITMPTYTYTYYNPKFSKNMDVSQRAILGHGGLLIGYVFNPTKPIHMGFSARIGAGGIGLVDDYSENHYNSNSSYYYHEYPYIAPLFVLSPQVDLEMNLTNWFKFRISAGYQYVTDASVSVSRIEDKKIVESELFNTSGYNTPTFSLGFVFGWFK